MEKTQFNFHKKDKLEHVNSFDKKGNALFYPESIIINEAVNTFFFNYEVDV